CARRPARHAKHDRHPVSCPVRRVAACHRPAHRCGAGELRASLGDPLPRRPGERAMLSLAAIEQFRALAAARGPLLIATDLDGTLAPIVEHAADARVPPGTLAVLDRL